jgi:hypothetical protein
MCGVPESMAIFSSYGLNGRSNYITHFGFASDYQFLKAHLKLLDVTGWMQDPTSQINRLTEIDFVDGSRVTPRR